MKRIWLCAALALGSGWATQASALNAEDYQIPYLGVSGLYEFPDSARDSDNGYGFRVSGGLPITPHGSVEFSYFDLTRSRHFDGKDDYQRALFVDYAHDFGTFGFDASFLPNFKPYVIGGIGAIDEDVQGHKAIRPGFDAGGGLYFPLKIGTWDWGWGLRTEFRAIGQYNGKHTAGADSDVLFDYHLEAGLQIPLSFLFTPPQAVVDKAPECETAVVNPETGRRDCAAVDSDGDGVVDGADQCPNTPPGTTVDDKGCPSESGRDSDGDGVLDSDDQCPDTPAGAQVDAKGCPVEQTFVLKGVNFETNSAVLTADSRGVLDSVARSLNAQRDIKVEIGGHTDNVGSASYNQTLSQQRAESVRQYLIGRGVDPERLAAHGYGATQPVAANQTEEGRAANRRVEFKILLH
jgi:outer membrane protein OmpA-like peptidoglycan-associated protein